MYQAVYKCRLCGEIFETGKKRNMQVLQFLQKLGEQDFFRSDDFFGDEIKIGRCMGHFCGNGDYGFADLQGFRKVDVPPVDPASGDMHKVESEE